MTNTPTTPTRDQLNQFLPNHEVVRAFENFFDQINNIQPSQITELKSAAATSSARSNAPKDKVAKIDFRRLAATANTAGRVSWDNSESTIGITPNSENFVIKAGQNEFIIAYNATGSNLAKGDVVYLSSAQNQRPTVAKAQANLSTTSNTTVGIVAETIPNSENGFVQISGKMSGVDTSSITAGQLLYLSATTAGNYTGTEPSAPDSRVRLGIVTHSDANSGVILINIKSSYSIEDIRDIVFTSLSDNDFLQYDLTTESWQNVSGPSGSIVGTTDTQTMTNKTLTSPTINSANINYSSGEILKTTASTTDGAGFDFGSLGNCPSSGDPSKWLEIDDNGTTRYIPSWT